MQLITVELSVSWGLDFYLYSALSVCFLVIASAASPFLVLASLFLFLSLSRALFPSLFLVAVVFPFFLLPLCLFLLASLSVFPLFLVPSSQSVTGIGKKKKINWLFSLVKVTVQCPIVIIQSKKITNSMNCDISTSSSGLPSVTKQHSGCKLRAHQFITTKL